MRARVLKVLDEVEARSAGLTYFYGFPLRFVMN